MGGTPIMSRELPEFNQDDIVVLEPAKVLQRRQITRDDKVVVQWLVQWCDIEALWEDMTFIQQQFPTFTD